MDTLARLIDSKDIRFFQIITLLSLIAYSSRQANFYWPVVDLVYIFFVGIIFQYVGHFIFERNMEIKSAIVTTCSTLLLLRAEDGQMMAIAVCVALMSKFLITYKGKHFFNPANFAIVTLSIFASHSFWPASGVWNNSFFYVLLFLPFGFMINKKVKTITTCFSFIGVYLSLHLIRNLWLGDSFSIYLLKFQSVPLWIFAFFMITDPRSNPSHRYGKFALGFIVAISAFIMETQFYVRHAYFYTLFVITMFTPFIDEILIEERFIWPRQS